MRNFTAWLNTFKDSIATWDYYTDFPKVYANVDKYKIELNLLNSLVGSKNIEQDFKSLVQKYPEVLQVIPLLLAKRSDNVRITEIEGCFDFNFKVLNYEIEDYVLFMNNTGLFDLLANRIVRDLVDYATGIEVGMDTNGRKNRTGKVMEDIVENHIQKAGFKRDVDYFKEMYKSDIEKRFGLDLSLISNDGKSEKRFDFVVKKGNHVYAIETSFYGSSGSKLNETARSYELLYRQSKNIEGFTFVWITDGCGWSAAKNNLQQTFDVMPTIFNIHDLENGILNSLLK